MRKLTFNQFCIYKLEFLYNPELAEIDQAIGYVLLKRMIIEKNEPHCLKEINRWENQPNSSELFGVPDVKYLRFLHPVLREYVVQNWKMISKLKI